MAVNVKDLRDWLATLSSDADVAIDEGGLMLIACNQKGGLEAYLEVGGEREEAAQVPEVCVPREPEALARIVIALERIASIVEEERARVEDVGRARVYSTHLGEKLRDHGKAEEPTNEGEDQ